MPPNDRRSAISDQRARSAWAAIALAALFLFAAITWVALESNEVVVLRTTGADGTVKETRTWIADEGGYAWIEAATAERPFFQHVLANPEVELLRGGEVHRCHAVAIATREGHEHIRRLLAEKYGWADAWIGLLQDTSRSVEVRLERRLTPPR